MNKKEAAEYLGVSVRALERYVQQGRLTVHYEKGKTRPTANFDKAELEAFKEELSQPIILLNIDTYNIVIAEAKARIFLVFNCYFTY